MEHYAPLLQTVLWVALIGGIVWRFHRPIHGLLTALQRRVEGGSGVKAGPFELSELRTQEPSKQREKLRSELEAQGGEPDQPREGEAGVRNATEGAKGEPSSAPPLSPETHPTDSPAPMQAPIVYNPKAEMARRTALLLQSEDLALRAIQADYGQPLQRQVTAGADPGFDGVFSTEGRVSIVEVKFVGPHALLVTIPHIKASLRQLANSIEKYKWNDPRLILAIVFELEGDVPHSDALLLRMVSGYTMEVIIRVFSLPELRRRFGGTEDDA